jgi:hypothetical protein
MNLFEQIIDNEVNYVSPFQRMLRRKHLLKQLKEYAALQSMYLTALRRGLEVSILFNVILLAVVLFTIGSR